MFESRESAGELLAIKLQDRNLGAGIIFAIARGGAVIGYAIAKKLDLPLKILIVKKVGHPDNPELAIGAVAPGNIDYIDVFFASSLGISQDSLNELLEEKRKEVDDRLKKYNISLAKNLYGKEAILTDDGIATGSTVKAAIKYIKNLSAKKIIVASPVVAKETYDELKEVVDEMVVLEVPESFGSVGQFYKYFPQIDDEKVMEIIKKVKN